jgi:RNA polymerase sigma-70 factor (ECF subfamily)
LVVIAARYVAADAEDLVQDAVIRALQSLTAFRRDAEPTTWLYRIVVNACIDRRRKEGRRRAEGGARNGEVTPAWPERLTLRRAVGSLGRDERQSYVLHDVLGYTHREIEDHYGIPVGTSKSRLFRARRLLYYALEGRSSCGNPPSRRQG